MAKKPAPAAETAVNRSQLIRDYHEAHPEATPAQVAKALTDQGHTVSAALTSQVLSGRRSAGGGKEKFIETVKLAGAFVRTHKGKLAEAESAIKSVGEFIDGCGGTQKALDALEVYKSLSESVKA